MTSTSPTKQYFAYGSNLWLSQMSHRCPSSTFTTVARLPDYKWFISSRGYANIRHSPGSEVWGMLYTLPPADEDSLDGYEGVNLVPPSYSKVMMRLETKEGLVEGLVYVDYLNDREGVVKGEYVGRMRCGIEDAVREGVPKSYIEGNLLGPLGLGKEVLDG